MLRSLILTIVAITVLGVPGSSRAEDKPAVAQDATQEWDGLLAERKKIEVRLDELRLPFAKGTPQEKGKIRTEMNTLINKYSTKVLPRLKALASAVFEKNPANTVAAGFLLAELVAQNKYPEMIKVADAILKTDPENTTALISRGRSRFAVHDFEGAITDLEAGQGPEDMLEAAKDYVEFWKEEQAIRAKEDALTGNQALPLVKLATNKGDIEILMFEDEAPNTVANFVMLVEAKFYDGLKFHRVGSGFMAQGGCPDSRDGSGKDPGKGGPGYTIKCECYAKNARRHFAGSLSMAHTAMKDTGGSQFFLTHLPTAHLNAKVGKEGGHTVFGRVVTGLDVVLAIQPDDVIKSATVIRKRPHDYVPKDRKPSQDE